MKHSYPRYLTIITVLLLMLASFSIGFQMSGGSRTVLASVMQGGGLLGSLDNSTTLKPVELFQDAIGLLQREYVEPITNPNELSYAAIRGMLASLQDPYTRFMDPKEFKEFNDDTHGSFAGIGATLDWAEISTPKSETGEGSVPPVTCPVCSTVITDMKHYRVRIVEPIAGSPAKSAGLQPNDFILKVNEMETDGKTVDEVADKIRGPEGTQVKLTIARKGIKEPLEMTITRAKIEMPATEKKMLDEKIAYLRLLKFNEKTASETQAALVEFKKADARGLVLDLRNNPGGLLNECIRVASMFLPEMNNVIVSTKGRSGQSIDAQRFGQQLYTGPMVVLVNKGSASASEILSGALKDYERATVIGESTFGKALVQSVLRMDGGAAMAVTTAHYYTPSGYDVGKKGVKPDVLIELDKDTKELSDTDNQAKAAIRILKDKMATAAK